MKRFFRKDWRKRWHEGPRTPEQMRDDLVVAFDRIEVLKLQVWILMAVATGEGFLIRWLATQLFNRIK